MKNLKLLVVVIVVIAMTATTGILASCKAAEPEVIIETVVETVTETVEVEAAAVISEERPDALDGNPVSPADFPVELLPGIDEIGVKPLKQYKIAFSNGDMTDNWRLVFVQDFEKWAAAYREEFGVEYIWTNSGSDVIKQISDIESLLSLKPDILIVAPMEDEPLEGTVDLCNELGIPLIIVDRPFLNKEPGPDSMYKMAITQDFYAQGVIQGKMVVDYLTNKYGEPKGNVIEMVGLLGASPTVLRSQGFNLVLDQYPDIRITDSVEVEWSRSIAYEKMEDFLQIYPKNSIDVVQGAGDGDVMGAIEAIKATGRTEILPGVFGKDGQLVYYEAMLVEEAAGTSETSPYYGMIAFEYAIRFLNGEFDGKDYQSTVMLPTRYWDLDPDRLDILRTQVDYLIENGLEFMPVEAGGFDQLTMDISDFYPVNYLEDPSVLDVEPFTTDEPLN